MSPELTGFALGLLLGAAKVMAIASVGFAIAWWRARIRIRTLEAEQLESGGRGEEIEHLHEIREGLSEMRQQLERLNNAQDDLLKQLSIGSESHRGALPPGPDRATRDD